MKKAFWMISVVCICLSAHAQDDRYYDNNGSDDVYNNSDESEPEQDNSAVTYQSFYDDLNPYGSWINNPQYGYVWVPLQAGAGFSPYLTNGHWEYTEYGWTWISDFEWGWATFHYGRWFQDPGYGWMWVPGYDWAPAWVVWGEYNNYYCWAPVWPGEYTSTHYGGRDHHWYFVEHNYINDPNVSNHAISNTVVNHDKTNIEPKINIIDHVGSYNRSVFFSGPKVKEVEKAVGRPVEHVKVASAPSAGATRITGDKVNVYRPDIKRAERQNAAPAHISRQEDLPRQNNTDTREPQRGIPQRDNNTRPVRQQPAQEQWTPPRQSAPRAEPQRQPASQPIDRGGGFIPHDRPAYQEPQRQFSAPPVMRQNSAPPARPGGGGRR
jgi:hypothetical protein